MRTPSWDEFREFLKHDDWEEDRASVEIPILFLETRPLAEEWTFRYLGAALAEHESEQHRAPQLRAAESPVNYPTVSPKPSRKRRTAGT